MIKIEKVVVRGLSELPETRRSFNSQNSSDSDVAVNFFESNNSFVSTETTIIGPKDLGLMQKLEIGGDSHAKMNRFIEVYLTLTLPRRVWVDFDTYRLGVDNIQPEDIEYFSDSTMHTLHKTKMEDIPTLFDEYTPTGSIAEFERCLMAYNNDPCEATFLKMKSGLAEGFYQTRRMKINYQALRHIYFDRKNHRQPEFKDFCKWIESLPYAAELITVVKKVKKITDWVQEWATSSDCLNSYHICPECMLQALCLQKYIEKFE
jgi:hypothetical protein